jgi:hypothetical protein
MEGTSWYESEQEGAAAVAEERDSVKENQAAG